MSAFLPFQNNIEVHGSFILATVNNLILQETCIPVLNQVGLSNIKENQWYPQDLFLTALKILDTTFSFPVIYKMGYCLANSSLFRFPLEDVPDLDQVDILYHAYHRKNNNIMVDQSGKMTEGIGHYNFHFNGKMVVMCHNPYPYHFDLGLLKGIVQRVMPAYTIEENDGYINKSQGGEFSYFTITKDI